MVRIAMRIEAEAWVAFAFLGTVFFGGLVRLDSTAKTFCRKCSPLTLPPLPTTMERWGRIRRPDCAREVRRWGRRNGWAVGVYAFACEPGIGRIRHAEVYTPAA